MVTTAKWTAGCLEGTGIPAQGREFPGDSAPVLVLPARADVTHTTHGELKQQAFVSRLWIQTRLPAWSGSGESPLPGLQAPPSERLLVGRHQSHHEGLDVTTSSNFHYLPKASSPKTIMLGVRASTYKVRGGHQHLIHTLLPSDTWNSTPERSTL